MRSTIAAAILVGAAIAVSDEASFQFITWANKFGKDYKTAEEYGLRFKNWL